MTIDFVTCLCNHPAYDRLNIVDSTTTTTCTTTLVQQLVLPATVQAVIIIHSTSLLPNKPRKNIAVPKAEKRQYSLFAFCYIYTIDMLCIF